MIGARKCCNKAYAKTETSDLVSPKIQMTLRGKEEQKFLEIDHFNQIKGAVRASKSVCTCSKSV